MSDPDDKTRIIRRSSGGTPAPAPGYQPPPPPAQNPRPSYPSGDDTIFTKRAAGGSDPDATRILQRSPSGSPQAPAPDSDPHTKLVRRPSSKPAATAEPNTTAAAPAGSADDMTGDPVVGWLVVIEGPGRGQCVTLGYGQNSIGREPGNRVVLAYGDGEISRHKHAMLTYDPRGRKFYIQHGDSTNLTYVEDSPVLAPTQLSGGESIRIGDKTVLKFVPLCGEEFDWND